MSCITAQVKRIAEPLHVTATIVCDVPYEPLYASDGPLLSSEQQYIYVLKEKAE